jgi:hypothetical protein
MFSSGIFPFKYDLSSSSRDIRWRILWDDSLCARVRSGSMHVRRHSSASFFFAFNSFSSFLLPYVYGLSAPTFSFAFSFGFFSSSLLSIMFLVILFFLFFLRFCSFLRLVSFRFQRGTLLVPLDVSLRMCVCSTQNCNTTPPPPKKKKRKRRKKERRRKNAQSDSELTTQTNKPNQQKPTNNNKN